MGKSKPGKPTLVDPNMWLGCGIDPRTGLPVKFEQAKSSKEGIKTFLRIIDEQDHCNKFQWYNLPLDMSGQELERLLYYRGSLVFFYDKDLEKFFVMPYALDGGLDAYARMAYVKPIPITNGIESKENKTLIDYFSKKKLRVVYSVKDLDEITEEEFYNSGVILYDYTRQLPQQIIPRSAVNEPVLDVMSECVPFMRTSLLLGTGVKGLRVQDDDQAANADLAGRSMHKAALTGNPFVPLIGTAEFQELTDGQLAKAEEYMLAMQSLDNLRLSGHGLQNGGLFQKNAHELQTEADMNGGQVGLVLQDNLSLRQNACNIINSIWAVGMWCEPSETISKADINGDGVIYDRNDDMTRSGAEVSADQGGNENE